MFNKCGSAVGKLSIKVWVGRSFIHRLSVKLNERCVNLISFTRTLHRFSTTFPVIYSSIVNPLFTGFSTLSTSPINKSISNIKLFYLGV